MSPTLNSILDTHPDLICRYNPSLEFTYANLAMVNFLGSTKDEVLGSNLLSWYPADIKNNILSIYDVITPERPSQTLIQASDTKTGASSILWTTIGLFEGDAVREYQSVGRNITAEVELEHKLKSQTQTLDRVQTELRSVLDAVPSRIWYKDDKNNILRLNQAAASSMGMTVAEVEGQNTYDLFGDAAKSYHEADLKVFESGVAIRGLIEAYTPETGESGWGQTDKIPFDDDPEEPRILVVSTDITELKEQEAILKSINKNLDDFASLVSHDLQAPLRKIAITAQLMELELGDQLPKSAGDYFKDISQGVSHMRTLIQSFLKFMRASPDSVALDTVNLTALLREMADEEMTEAFSDVGGTLSLPDNDILVRGDMDLLRQIFANLLGNSIKYRAADRPIEVEITAKKDQQFWAITVSDNGTGIDENSSEQFFDLFGRSKPHKDIEGSGIGLALCRRIITLHGGTIELVSKNTPGSSFRVKLNRARQSDG